MGKRYFALDKVVKKELTFDHSKILMTLSSLSAHKCHISSARYTQGQTQVLARSCSHPRMIQETLEKILFYY